LWVVGVIDVDDNEKTTQYCNLDEFDLRKWAQAMVKELVATKSDDEFDAVLVSYIGNLAEKLRELDARDEKSPTSSFANIRIFWGYLLHRGLEAMISRRKIYFQCVPVDVWRWVGDKKLQKEVFHGDYGLWNSDSVVDLPVLRNAVAPTLAAFIGKLIVYTAEPGNKNPHFVPELYARVMNAVQRTVGAKKMPFWTVTVPDAI